MGALRFEDAAGPESQAPSALRASMGTIWDTTEAADRVTCPTERDAESVCSWSIRTASGLFAPVKDAHVVNR
jgi:hypothetical protein